MSSNLGCVLAIRDRPPEYLERTLQTFAYQTWQPLDKVLVDYGSAPDLSAEYECLCRHYGWRYLRQEPAVPLWHPAAAYNLAVDNLDAGVAVVFKSDMDVLLGQDVLGIAAEKGREKLYTFACLTTAAGANYPPRLESQADLLSLRNAPEPPVPMPRQAVHVFPRRWFTAIGGYDLELDRQEDEDRDLRERAGRSIGIVEDTTALLIHQWHPLPERLCDAAYGTGHPKRALADRRLIRNGGILLPTTPSAPETAPSQEAAQVQETSDSVKLAPATPPRMVFATRSGNDVLYRLSEELLGPNGSSYPRHRISCPDSLAYFRELAELEADWVVHLDEDAFVLDPGRLLALVSYMQEHGYAACGMPDGGVVPTRRHNPVACHAAFTVFDLRRVRPVWRDGNKVAAAGPRPEHENAVASFACRGPTAFDHDKPYYGIFFTLLDAGESILYLDAELWRDGITTLIKSPDGEPLVLHTGFGRCWSDSYHTRRRILDALDYVRQLRRLEPVGLDPATPRLSEAVRRDGLAVPLRASPPPAGEVKPGLTSIIIVTHNELAFTQRCVDSIRRGADEDYELIFVDNGSSDGTVEYLHALPGATVIVNSTNRGFPAAANQGLCAARGEQLLLLNNDTVVPAGWLRRLLAPLVEDPRIGLVGPCSNAVSGPQQVPVSYRHLDELDAFAQEWANLHAGERAEIGRLVGFCLLIRRELLDQIGYLDERFGVGCFEDDDYCRRAVQAGYRAVIARDAFLHHFGSQTFRGSGLDLGAILRRNEEIFRGKWTPAPTSRPPAEVRPLDGKGIQLSLCMIVRDNASILAACLNSIRPWVDEMVVVDTGSRDDTPLLAERLGARVFSFPWCDDFSAARNESLRHAHGHWLFWMDSDDVIDEDNGRKLRALASQDVDPAILGFIMQVHCPGPGVDGALHTTVVDHVKLLRNLPGIAFEGRIHEQVLSSIRAMSGEVAWTDIFVVHAGYDHSPEGQARKRERDLRLLHREHRERGDHPFTLFNLGMTYADLGRYAEAIAYLQRSIARASPGESHLRKAYALLASCHQQAGDREAAWAACQDGLRRTPADPELRFRSALLLHEGGRLREAARTYEELLASPPERHFSSIDQGITGYKARQNLAIVYQDLGDWKKATEQWRRVVADKPGYRVGWRGLVEALLRQDEHREAEALLEQLGDGEQLMCEKCLLRGQVATARGDLDAARSAFEQAVGRDAEDATAQQALCHFLFDHGRPEEAEQALKELLGRQPDDPSAHHNLGTVYLRLGRPQAAAEAYRYSLQLRPHSVATAHLLETALRQTGLRSEDLANT